MVQLVSTCWRFRDTMGNVGYQLFPKVYWAWGTVVFQFSEWNGLATAKTPRWESMKQHVLCHFRKARGFGINVDNGIRYVHNMYQLNSPLQALRWTLWPHKCVTQQKKWLVVRTPHRMKAENMSFQISCASFHGQSYIPTPKKTCWYMLYTFVPTWNHMFWLKHRYVRTS